VVVAVLVALLAPVSLVAGWAWSQVSDTDRFVATYGSLSSSPQAQALIGNRLTNEITARLGVIGQLPATRDVTTRATDAVLTSDAGEAAWRVSLQRAHVQLNALLAAKPGSVEINDGALQLQLGPFADVVRQRLVDAGVPFASLLPEVDAAITLAQLDPDAVARARLAYRLLEATTPGLSWLALLAGVATVLLWPTRRGGLILAGSAAMLGAGVLAVALVQASAIVPKLVTADAQPLAALFVRTALESFHSPALALLVAGSASLFTGLMAVPERT
jgi:hypothetical protein